MQSSVEQTRYWMWTRRKFNGRPAVFNSPIPAMGIGRSSYHQSWEEQAFAEDSSGLLGGCIWPPRSYSCSFCRREFRSAQALGGHMNVHRRDRARLKQSSSPSEETPEQFPAQVSTLEYYNPNMNPNPNSGVVASPRSSSSDHTLVSPSYSLSIVREREDEPFYAMPRSFPDSIPIRVLNAPELKLGIENWKLREVGMKGKRDSCIDDDAITSVDKKRRTDAAIPSFLRGTSSSLHLLPSEVLKLSPSPVEELDLELRLGDPPKIK